MVHTHKFANTAEGGMAGTWQSSDPTSLPICTWSYDLRAGLLRVTRGTVMHEFECPVGNGMKTESERRQILPHLALTYARNIKLPAQRYR